MWKQKPEIVTSPIFIPTAEPVRTVPPAGVAGVHSRPVTTNLVQGRISKGIVVRGEISGSDSLFIDGTVEGTIHIPGERVTVGLNGHVIAPRSASAAACITAGEIEIRGAVIGNIVAIERLDIRAQASLTGNVSTARVSIEDGACFRGGIDIRREARPAEAPPELEPLEAVEV